MRRAGDFSILAELRDRLSDAAGIPDRHSMKTLLIDRVKALSDRKIERNIWSSHSSSEFPGA